MATARKIAFNFIASSIGRVIGLFFSLASIGLTARALSTDGYGGFSTISAFLFLFMGLADLGLYSLMLREISRPGADEKYIVSNFFSLRLISIVLFLGLAFVAVLFFPYSKEIKIGIIFTSASVVFMSLSQLLMPIFQKTLSTGKTALSEVIGRFSQFLMTLAFFKLGYGLFWFLFAMIFSSAITFLLNLFYSRKYNKFSLGTDFKYIKRIFKLTVPIALSIAFTMIYYRGNTILLSIIQSQRDVGLFNLGYKVLENLTFFPAVLVGLIMPFLCHNATGNIGEFKRVMQESFNLLCIGSIPLAVGGFFFSDFIVEVLGGKDFSAAATPLRVLFFSAIFIFFGNLAGNSLIALNAQKKLAWIYFFGAVFSIFANIFLISRYSYNGAALGSLLVEALVTVLMFVFIFKKIGWIPPFGTLLKSILSSGVMCFPLLFFKPEGLASNMIMFVVCFVVYFSTLFLIKGIRREDVFALIKAK